MQHGKQPLWARLQLLARLTLNAGKDAANQPARLAHLDDGNDRAIWVQGNQGPAQIVRLGHRGTPSIDVSDEIAILAARPIASLRWRGESRGSGVQGRAIVDVLERQRLGQQPLLQRAADRVRYSSPSREDPADTGLRQELELAPRGLCRGNRDWPTRSAGPAQATSFERLKASNSSNATQGCSRRMRF